MDGPCACKPHNPRACVGTAGLVCRNALYSQWAARGLALPSLREFIELT